MRANDPARPEWHGTGRKALLNDLGRPIGLIPPLYIMPVTRTPETPQGAEIDLCCEAPINLDRSIYFTLETTAQAFSAMLAAYLADPELFLRTTFNWQPTSTPTKTSPTSTPNTFTLPNIEDVEI